MRKKKPNNAEVPSYDELIIPTLVALKKLGGSGSIEEINEKVYELKELEETVLSIPHKEDGDSRSEVDYRLAWARTYLKKFGLIENSSRGIWSILNNDIDPYSFNQQDIVKRVRDLSKKENDTQKPSSIITDGTTEQEMTKLNWQEALLNVLQNMSPSGFERLCQRLLRESGFIQVEVTGQSGDGGIDGKGIARLNGFLSFHVFFQCKRFKGSVGSSDIRNFRGAMQGRADKGLFITTGRFTREATKEASRDGVPHIDLIDGIELCEKLKELRLGVKTEIITSEEVTINPEWFSKI